MISHFVLILELQSSTTRGSGIDRSTLSHARERTVSSPGQTNSTCWALSLCAVSHSLHALLSKLHCMPRGWPPCNTARTPDTRFVEIGLCIASCHQGCIPMWQTQFPYTSSSLYNVHDNFHFVISLSQTIFYESSPPKKVSKIPSEQMFSEVFIHFIGSDNFQHAADGAVTFFMHMPG